MSFDSPLETKITQFPCMQFLYKCCAFLFSMLNYKERVEKNGHFKILNIQKRKRENFMKNEKEYMAIYDDFKACSKFFQAIGNETRQGILLFLIKAGETGARVSEITENAHLSRPAVSHHLNVLKEANIIHCRPEGTSHYYTVGIEDYLPILHKSCTDLENFVNAYYADKPEDLARLRKKMGMED